MAEPHALFAHIFAQTRQNVELLIAHMQISEADGEAILTKLSVNAADRRLEESSIVLLTQKTQQLNMSPASAPPKVEARATWAWTSEDPSDLTLEAGEIIEIITETNADWWTGRSRSGRQGLFPSNYVEKLPPRSLSPIFVPEPRKSMASSVRSMGSADQRYSSPAMTQPTPGPQPLAYSGGPESLYPPPSGYYAPAGAPPPGAANSYTQGGGQAPERMSRFGGMGQLMAPSAGGGVGPGAGKSLLGMIRTVS